MSSISAGTTTGTALVSTGDTSGNLVLQTNGGTTALTLNTSGAVGVGSSPGYGSSGQVLTSAGSSAAPSWATPAAGGSWIYLSSATASSSSTVDVETGISGTYDAYAIVAENVFTSASVAVNMQWKIGGTYIAANYDWTVQRLAAGSTTYSATAGTATSQITVLQYTQGTGSYSAAFILYFYTPTDATNYRSMHWIGMQASSGGGMGYGRSADLGVLSGIRFLPASGTITTGTFRLYGIKNS